MKIYAYEMNPEYTDYSNYLDFDGWDDFIITGNRDYASYHTDYNLFYRIQRYCIDYDDLLNAIDDSGKNYGRYYTPEFKNATEAISYYLDIKPSTKQVHDIIKTLRKPGGSYYDDDDRMAELLSIYKICEYDNAPSEIDSDIVYDSDGYFNYYGSDIVYDDDLLKAEIAREENVKPEDINIYHIATKMVTVESWS